MLLPIAVLQVATIDEHGRWSGISGPLSLQAARQLGSRPMFMFSSSAFDFGTAA